jgi:hypothetical protein
MESARQIDSPSVGLAASDGEKTDPHGKRHRSRRRPCHPPVPGSTDRASEGRIVAGLSARSEWDEAFRERFNWEADVTHLLAF